MFKQRITKVEIKTPKFGRETSRHLERIARGMLKSICPKIRKIGSGCYATVYGHPSLSEVYKVGNMADNYGYLSFVKELKKQKMHNPFTPVVHDVQILVPKDGRKSDGVFIIKMERLNNAKTHRQRKELRSVAKWFDENLSEYGTDVCNLGCESLGVTVVIPPNLVELIKMLNISRDRTGNSGDYAEFDFHSANFMYRDNQVVCIDPLC